MNPLVCRKMEPFFCFHCFFLVLAYEKISLTQYKSPLDIFFELGKRDSSVCVCVCVVCVVAETTIWNGIGIGIGNWKG